jgi:hypothetical protein
MDTLSASPRHHLSDSQLEALRLFTKLNSGDELPTVRQVKYERDETVVKLAGSNPQTLKTSHGNYFTMNSLGTTLRHVRIFHHIYFVADVMTGMGQPHDTTRHPHDV